jgi:hypothetical protein
MTVCEKIQSSAHPFITPEMARSRAFARRFFSRAKFPDLFESVFIRVHPWLISFFCLRLSHAKTPWFARTTKRNISERKPPGVKNGPLQINDFQRQKRNALSVLVGGQVAPKEYFVFHGIPGDQLSVCWFLERQKDG